MLEFFSIFTKGGIVLWLLKLSETEPKAAMDSLVTEVLLEAKTVETHNFGKLKLEYKINNQHDLVFAVAYNKLLALSYVKNLLKQVEFEFCRKYLQFMQKSTFEDFNQIFNECLEYYEFKQNINSKKQIKNQNIQNFDEESINLEDKFIDNKNLTQITLSNQESEFYNSKNQKTENEPSKLIEIENNKIINSNMYNLIKNKNVKNNGKKNNLSSKKAEKAIPKKKINRTWDNKISKEEEEILDFSEKNSEIKIEIGQEISIKDRCMNIQPLDFKVSDKKTASNQIFGFFQGLIGSRIITEQLLEAPMAKMKEHLSTKNVAIEICEKICMYIINQLIGKTFNSFQGISSIINQSIEESLTNILTPKRDVNILNQINDSNASRPFVIVFCGVNGVGKSTNLAKIAYHLLSNNQRVMIAACDTFRSGAIEQLKTHVYRFNSMFPSTDPNCIIYDKGYGKDASSVASEAIKAASKNNYTVVLIDTAGRMQNNEPLMRTLAKLIKVNRPNLVLFVGEALVGNDGVNQLMEFDKKLTEFSESKREHMIDGIILTKFDTIDDKVGAAISMTYATGQPIVFVGVGQTYNDLRLIDVKYVVKLLLS